MKPTPSSQPPPVSPGERLFAAISAKNRADAAATGTDRFSKLGGGLAFHCSADLKQKRVTDAAAMATAFRGYEALLPGRDLRQAGLVSATASGICGGVHATASALCLEMALAISPPPLGIVLRNLLLSCQYLNDNTMHLFVLAGPDYSQQVVEATSPAMWHQARLRPARRASVHGFSRIGDIMVALNKPEGGLYRQALDMIRTARKAYATLGGKYPHSESIIPGGVSIQVDAEKLQAFRQLLETFNAYSRRTIALWDDVFDFMLDFQPEYARVGASPPSLLDFGQWDHEDYYDARYAHCDSWGENRWSTPGAVIDGVLQTTRLSELNAGIEEFIDHSWYANWVDDEPEAGWIKTDPLGNTLSPSHPWNKRIIPAAGGAHDQARPYSWGTSLTWRRQNFEVGAYARMYISALAGKLPDNAFVHATGDSLVLALPAAENGAGDITWRIPAAWNAFERNRARAYALAFNLAVTLENSRRAAALLDRGETAVSAPFDIPDSGRRLGVGLWGAGRGFLAHWAVLDGSRIDNYQIAIPSRINAAPRTPWGDPGPCEQAVLNTPILEDLAGGTEHFTAIDIQRAIQSFDPCMATTAHILIDNADITLDKVVDTCFPI